MVFKPRCTELGHYLPKQCHGEMCYCVDKKGSKIEGTEVDKLDPGTLHCAGIISFILFDNTRSRVKSTMNKIL